jgi:hypothetical protein
MAIDLEAPIWFLRTAFQPHDWIAVLLKSHETGATAQRVGPVSLVASARFQAWLRAQSARRFSVFVSVNAIRPQRKARTRDAVGEIRHVFLDADRDGQVVLSAIAGRRDLPAPSCVLHSSPNRLHVLWRVSGFTKAGVEALQKQLATELGTDKAATSCAQVTRLPGFFNHKYRPAPTVTVEYASPRWQSVAADFPQPICAALATSPAAPVRRDRRQLADMRERARRYLAVIPPAVAGQHGDAATFRVCCRLVRGFALDDVDALAAISDWNQACSPPWPEGELLGKLRSARRYGREPVGRLLTRPGYISRQHVASGDRAKVPIASGYPKRLPKRPPVD